MAALVGPLAQAPGRMDIVRVKMPVGMGALGVAWSCRCSDWHRPARVELRSAHTFTIIDDDGRGIPATYGSGEKVSSDSRCTACLTEGAGLQRRIVIGQLGMPTSH